MLLYWMSTFIMKSSISYHFVKGKLYTIASLCCYMIWLARHPDMQSIKYSSHYSLYPVQTCKILKLEKWSLETTNVTVQQRTIHPCMNHIACHVTSLMRCLSATSLYGCLSICWLQICCKSNWNQTHNQSIDGLWWLWVHVSGALWVLLSALHTFHETVYRQVSNIRRTKSQHLKDPRAVLRLSLPNPLKPDVKSRMKM